MRANQCSAVKGNCTLLQTATCGLAPSRNWNDCCKWLSSSESCGFHFMNQRWRGDGKIKTNSLLALVNLAGVHSLKSHNKVPDNKVALGVWLQSDDDNNNNNNASLVPLSPSSSDMIPIRRSRNHCFHHFLCFYVDFFWFFFLPQGIQTVGAVYHQVPL